MPENRLDRNPLGSKAKGTLEAFSQTHQIDNLDLYLGQKIQEGVSVIKLASQIGLSKSTLLKYCRATGIPVLSQQEASSRALRKNMQDPEFREKSFEASRQAKIEEFQDPERRQRQADLARSLWQRDGFREKHAAGLRRMLSERWQDESWREAHSERTRLRLADPEVRRKMTEGVQAKWQDSEYRIKIAKTLGERSTKQWADPEFRRIMTEKAKKRWDDSEYAQNVIEAARRVRLDPDRQTNYVLPTIHGQRKDIPHYSLSSWEANLARILMLTGREYLPHEVFRLQVPDNDQETYNLPSQTDFALDFLTLDPREQFVGYEIMAHPFEDPEGLLKAQLLRIQYPNIRLVLITDDSYSRLERVYKPRINENPDLVGWETRNDNLRTNPERWGSANKSNVTQSS